MDVTRAPRPLPRRRHTGRLTALAALAGALAALSAAPVPEARAEQASSSLTRTQGSSVRPARGPGLSGRGLAAASLEQCATASAPQSERAAAFAGEMTASATSTRMQMRIELQERAPAEARYRTVGAPGLGVWQSSDPGVKLFTHIEQVTNLSAPAEYRGAVEFRWLDGRGRVLKQEELHTASCVQPAPAGVPPGSGASGASPG